MKLNMIASQAWLQAARGFMQVVAVGKGITMAHGKLLSHIQLFHGKICALWRMIRPRHVLLRCALLSSRAVCVFVERCSSMCRQLATASSLYLTLVKC